MVRDGVPRSRYAVHGSGPATVVLLPTWSIVHSRMWKAQVPYLARHHRVVTFDGRGSGGSGRPVGAAAYANAEYAADTVAVMDAAGVDRAVLVGPLVRCRVGRPGGRRAPRPGAGARRDRAAVRVVAAARPGRARHVRRPASDGTEGWAKYNKHHWLDGGYDDFVEFFFAQMFHEPHSTKQIEDGDRLGARGRARRPWSTRTAGRLGCDGAELHRAGAAAARRCAARCWCSTAPRTGSARSRRRAARRADRRRRCSLLDGAGHGPPMRATRCVVNRELDRFVERVARAPGIREDAAALVPGAAPAARGARALRRRSGSATPGATWRSSTSCAPSTPTCGSTGWPRTR